MQQFNRRLRRIRKQRTAQLKNKTEAEAAATASSAIDFGPQKHMEFEVTLTLEQHIEYTFKETMGLLDSEVAFRTIRPLQGYSLEQFVRKSKFIESQPVWHR